MKKYIPRIMIASSLPFLSGCLSSSSTLKIGNNYIERDALSEIGTGLSTIFDMDRDGIITQEEVYSRTTELEQILDRASKLNNLYSKIEDRFYKKTD